MMSLALVSLAAGCASGGNEQVKNANEGTKPVDSAKEVKEVSGTVNLYTSESQDLVNEMIQDFKKKQPKIDVKIYRSGTGAVISKIEAEQMGGAIQADVIWFADIDYYSKLAKKRDAGKI